MSGAWPPSKRLAGTCKELTQTGRRKQRHDMVEPNEPTAKSIVPSTRTRSLPLRRRARTSTQALGDNQHPRCSRTHGALRTNEVRRTEA